MSGNKDRFTSFFAVTVVLFLLPAAALAQRVNAKESPTPKSTKVRLAVFAKVLQGEHRQWGADEMASSAIEETLSNNGFVVVNRAQLETLTKELEGGVSVFNDPREAAQIGKRVSAKYIIIAKVQDISKKKNWKALGAKDYLEVTIQFQAVNCETSEIDFPKTYKEESKGKVTIMDKSDGAFYKERFNQVIWEVARKFVDDLGEELPALRSKKPVKSGSDADEIPRASSSNKSAGKESDDIPRSSLSASKNSGKDQDEIPRASAKSDKSSNKEKESKAPVSDEKSSKIAQPKSKPSQPQPKPTPPASTVDEAPTSTTAAPPAKGDGEVVIINGTRIGVEISGVPIGQTLEVYTKVKPIKNSRNEIVGYDFDPADKCATLKVIELRPKMVYATLEKTFAPGGKADATPNVERLKTFYQVRKL